MNDRIAIILDKNVQDAVFSTFLAIILVVNIFVFVYQHPVYEKEFLRANFKLLTHEGVDLGYSTSSLKINYRSGRHPGKFLLSIKTEASKPLYYQSIDSRDIHYKVSFIWRSMPVTSIEDAYFGAMIPERGEVMYSTFNIPSGKYQMRKLEHVFGVGRMVIEAEFFNSTSDTIIAKGREELLLLLIQPSIKPVSFTILVVFITLIMITKSGPLYKNWKSRDARNHKLA